MDTGVLIFWFICGLIAGAIYRAKGRSEALGCLAGFFSRPNRSFIGRDLQP